MHLPSELTVPYAGPVTGANYRQHVESSSHPRRGFESAVTMIVAGLAEYARANMERFESPIGDDYVLGDEWRSVANGLLGLLNGDCGRLDCGSLDRFVRELATANNVDLE